MATILQTAFSSAFSWMKTEEWGMIHISLKFVPGDPIKKFVLVQVVSWHQAGDEPSAEPMMIQLTNTCFRHQASVSWTVHNHLVNLQVSTTHCRLKAESQNFVDLIFKPTLVNKNVLILVNFYSSWQ